MTPYYQNENGSLYNANFLKIAETLPEKSQQLIIADPPYFQVKGEFDFIWKDFDAYLEDVEKWAVACKRILADNGTLFWYGDAKNIAYSQIIFDKHFNLINNLVWNKGSFMGLEESTGLRSFAPCTERILMYGSNTHDATGLDFIEKEYIAPRNPFALELKKARLKKGVSINQVAEYGKFYGNVNHGGAVTNWERGYNVPLPEQWKILCDNLPIIRIKYEDLRKEYEDLRKEYEDLRKEYEDLRRPFNNFLKLQEVIKYKNEQVKSSKYDHDTVKPESLTQALILTCSRKCDNVFIPFVGSGTECVVSERENRKWTGCEIEKKHCETAKNRIENEREQLKLEF